MTPQDVQGWASLGTLLGIMYMGFMQYTNSQKQRDFADRQNAVTDKIHILVNSRMGSQLKLTMILAKRLASITNLPEDKSLAQESERLYEEHEIKQSIVDQKETI